MLKMVEEFNEFNKMGHFVSFNIVSLFTNIRQDETINLAVEKIFEHHRMKMSKIQLKRPNYILVLSAFEPNIQRHGFNCFVSLLTDVLAAWQLRFLALKGKVLMIKFPSFFF